MDNKRPLTNIKNDIKVITGNKLSASQSKLLFMGIIYELILRKDLFPKKINLEKFVNKLLVVNFKDKKPFKEYLYSSRTLLGGRILKKIQTDIEYGQIIKIVHELYRILPDEDSSKNEAKKNIKMTEEIAEWMDYINGDSK